LAVLGLSRSMQDVLVVVCEIFSYDIWDLLLQHANALVMVYEFLVAACGGLIPHPGIEPGPPALGARNLSHWTNKEVPRLLFSS